MAAVATVLAGAVGLIVGWLVSGYQNITEKLTEERRGIYQALIREADKVNENPRTDRTTLEQAASDAQFICSDEMMKSRRIEALLKAVATGGWEDERARFFKVARYESLNNSQWGRRLRWRDYGGTASGTVPAQVNEQSGAVTRETPQVNLQPHTVPDRADPQG